MAKDNSKKWFESWFDTKYYHILYKSRDYSEAELFIQKIITHFGINNQHNCLDLACGKGRHSIFLSKKGPVVTGVDLSEQSILEAQKSENNTLSFFTHDMRIPAWNNHFDFVLNLFTSFGYFENEQDNFKTIANISDSLKPDGTLVLDFMNATKVINNLVGSETKKNDGITFNLKREVINGFITKTIQFEDEGEQFEYQEKVQALKLADFEKYLKAANLKIVDIFGNYNLEDFDEQNSDRLILIAKKA